MKFFMTSILFFTLFSFGSAQSCVSGKVTNPESGEELIGANIVFEKNGDFISDVVTDLNGNYKINIDPGIYDMVINYIGLPNKQINGVIVNEGQTTFLNIEMPESDLLLIDCIKVYCICIPVIDKDDTTTKQAFESRKIQRVPTRSIKEISSLTAGITFQN